MQIVPYGNNGFELVADTDFEKQILKIYGGKIYEAIHNTKSGNLNFGWKKKDQNAGCKHERETVENKVPIHSGCWKCKHCGQWFPTETGD